MKQQAALNKRNIYAIPVGSYFDRNSEDCYLVYAPLKNVFFLVKPDEIDRFEKELENGELSDELKKIVDDNNHQDSCLQEISEDTFCTLHLLLNEKCNFNCGYCYSAAGRSKQELGIDTIRLALKHFLSAERNAVKERTVMFMGGGEPTLSWQLLEQSTIIAEQTAKEEGIRLHLSLTTNGSVLNQEKINFLKEHDFTVQVSFEVLPDVQTTQRGAYDSVAKNINRLCDAGVSNYLRATITAMNVNRICEMVEHCHKAFPKVTKLSCQQVVDKDYFANTDIVDKFFDTYFNEFNRAVELAKSYGIELRSSSSHLINYSRRERFCYNLLCLTPYGTLTTCPDISNPTEQGYDKAVIGKVDTEVTFDKEAFERETHGTIHNIDACRNCFARWNCGSGCPSSRKTYSDEIFNAICNYYRRILAHNLIHTLAQRHENATGRNMFEDIKQRL